MKEIVGLYGNIEGKLGQILESSKYLDLQLVLQQLGKLEESINHLKQSASHITHSVTSETKSQQASLLKSLQEQHIKHARDSREVVILAIRKEIEKASIDERKLDSVEEQLADIAESAVITMSKHLESNYSENTQKALNRVEITVRRSMEEILSEVSGFEEQVSDIPIVRGSHKRDQQYGDSKY